VFRLMAPEEPCRWPVKVQIPQAGGRTITQTFHADFRLKTQDEIEQLTQLGDRGFLQEVVAGWEGVADEAGEALPFSEANLDLLVAIPYAKRALMAAYFEFVAGIRAKN